MDNPLAVIRSAVSQLQGSRILDIGCGEGGLARQLAAEGALVTGIDPLAQAIAKARANVPGASFEAAIAEDLPFADSSFDLVVMVNSLHHVPVSRMDDALREARRVLREPGTLVVIEPLASGSFFDAMQRIEDETEVRRAAQLSLERGRPHFTNHRTLGYVRRESFKTAEQFIARIVAVDPARQAVVDSDRDHVLADVRRAATRTEDGALAFDQPIKADILSVCLNRIAIGRR